MRKTNISKFYLHVILIANEHMDIWRLEHGKKELEFKIGYFPDFYLPFFMAGKLFLEFRCIFWIHVDQRIYWLKNSLANIFIRQLEGKLGFPNKKQRIFNLKLYILCRNVDLDFLHKICYLICHKVDCCVSWNQIKWKMLFQQRNLNDKQSLKIHLCIIFDKRSFYMEKNSSEIQNGRKIHFYEK